LDLLEGGALTPEADPELKPKPKVLRLATPIAKAYVERESRKRKEPEPSPLLSREAFSGQGCLHLREEENDKGILIVNGSLIVHLNTTALFYLRPMFQGDDDEKVLRKVSRAFKVRAAIARQDLADLKVDIERIEKGLAPKRGARVEPLSGSGIAPFRADLTLTYRCKPSESIPPGSPRELSVEEWIKALDNLWNFGVPHVCIMGGEPTLREDLVDIIEHASALGMMVGLLTDGERLSSNAFKGRLMDAGLSYVQVTLASDDETIHAKVLGTPDHAKTVKGIEHCLKDGTPVLVNIPITKDSEYSVEGTVDRLVMMGVRAITVNALDLGDQTAPEWLVAKALERARKAARGRARIFHFGPVNGKAPPWQAPGETETVSELALGDLEWGAGVVSIHLQPDGAITAGRAHGAVLGNILTHSWNMIWYHSVLKEVRAKQAEGRRWKALQELGFTGYPLFPGLKVQDGTK
jgi:MoaA/NifB/PqqE/SkfB family radical SAM enzyme